MKKVLKVLKDNWFVLAVFSIVSLVLILIITINSPNNSPNVKDGKIPKIVSTNLHSPFKATAQIDYNGMMLDGTFEKSDVGVATFAVTSPDSLSGMKFSYDNSVVTVSYKGFDFDVPNNSKLLNTAIKYTIDIIDSASDPTSVSIVSNEDGIALNGVYDKLDFNISLGKDNAINSITLPEIDLTIKLSKVEY